MEQEKKQNPRLSEEEVRERLKSCKDLQVVNEVYSFGQSMVKEIIDSIRVVESKAVSFAAYGAAIVTLLVSSSATWSKLGNQYTLWIGACAGLSALICTVFSVKAITLKEHESVSQDEWLKTEVLTDEVTIKRYRILVIWGTMQSRISLQEEKVRHLFKAQFWLKVSVAFLVVLLFHIAQLYTFEKYIYTVGSMVWIPGR